MNPKVSIIMPVYNAEKYLHRAIDSILAQTMQDFELICIDDGSTDSSGQILDEYAEKLRVENLELREEKKAETRNQKLPTIRVVHKNNEGVSAARQTGLDAATGEYTIHADSDDWVEPTMLEELYNKAKEEDADVVICDYYNDCDSRTSIRKQQPTSLESNQVLRDLFQQLHGSCCNKLVRRACYSEYDIRFPEGINYCEDFLTWVQLFQHDVRISYLNKAFYHYCVNDTSITNNYTRQKYNNRLLFQSKLENILDSEKYRFEIEESSFSVFNEGVMYNILKQTEFIQGLKKHWLYILKNVCLRWKCGYILRLAGIKKISQLLIRF